MDGHDAHGVVVGLGQDRLGDPGALGRLQLDPAQVLAQAAVGGLAPGPGLVDDEPQPPPHVARPAFGEAELERAAVAGDAVEQLRRRLPVPAVVQAAQVGEADAHRVVVGNGVGLLAEVAPAASPLDLEAEQVVVAAAEQRRAQRGDGVHLVGRVVDGPQHHEQVAHGPGGVDERARLGPVGDAGGLERVLQEGQRRARGHEDGDVAEARRAPPTVAVVDRPSSSSARTTVAATSPASAARIVSARCLRVLASDR